MGHSLLLILDMAVSIGYEIDVLSDFIIEHSLSLSIKSKAEKTAYLQKITLIFIIRLSVRFSIMSIE